MYTFNFLDLKKDKSPFIKEIKKEIAKYLPDNLVDIAILEINEGSSQLNIGFKTFGPNKALSENTTELVVHFIFHIKTTITKTNPKTFWDFVLFRKPRQYEVNEDAFEFGRLVISYKDSNKDPYVPDTFQIYND